jgi:ankyrin repeat protein
MRSYVSEKATSILTSSYYAIFSTLNWSWALHHAAGNNDVKEINRLLDNYFSVDAVMLGSNETALNVAAKKGHFEAAKLLLERGADPHHSGDGATPLCNAIKAKCMPLIQLLVNNYQVSLDAKCYGIGGMYLTPAQIAAEMGDVEMLEQLEKLGATVKQTIKDEAIYMQQKNEVRDWYEKNNTPKKFVSNQLFYEISNGKINVVRALLKFPYCQNQIKKDINTMLWDLSLKENIKTEFSGIYEKFKDNSYAVGDVSSYQEFDNTNKAPLIFQTVLNGDIEMTSLLMEYGADVNIKVNETSAFDIAEQFKNQEMVCVLKSEEFKSENKNHLNYRV